MLSLPEGGVTLLAREDLERKHGMAHCRLSPACCRSPLVWELTAFGLLQPGDAALRPAVFSSAAGRAVPATVTRLEPLKWDETSARFRIEVPRPAVGPLDALEVSLARWSGEDHIDFLLGEPALAVVLPDAAACAQVNECDPGLVSDLHALITVGSSTGAIAGLGSWLGVADHVAAYCRSAGLGELEALVRGQVRPLLLAPRRAAAAVATGAFYRRRRSLHFWTPLLAQVLLVLRWTLGDWRGASVPVWPLVSAAHGLNLYMGLAPPCWQPRLQPVSGSGGPGVVGG